MVPPTVAVEVALSLGTQREAPCTDIATAATTDGEVAAAAFFVNALDPATGRPIYS